MKQVVLKTGVVATMLATAACTCVKGPELEVAPVAMKSNYGEAAYAEKAKVFDDNPTLVKEVVMMDTDRVFFDYDSAALTPKAQTALRTIAASIKSSDASSVVVEGHADERGTREYNLALGDRRAVSIKKFLVGLGVDGKSIRTVSFGKERPANRGHNAAAWAENRRGVVVVK